MRASSHATNPATAPESAQLRGTRNAGAGEALGRGAEAQHADGERAEEESRAVLLLRPEAKRRLAAVDLKRPLCREQHVGAEPREEQRALAHALCDIPRIDDVRGRDQREEHEGQSGRR